MSVFINIFSAIDVNRLIYARHGLVTGAYEAVRPEGTHAEAMAKARQILEQREIRNAAITINPVPETASVTDEIMVTISIPVRSNVNGLVIAVAFAVDMTNL